LARRALPPLIALRAFEAFARQGRMTAAADELCVTHGAISRQIKHLEDTLGARLIEGPRNRLRITEAGLKLAEASTRAFDLIEAAAPRPRASSPGPLEVSCLATLGMKWLIPRLPGLVDRHPDLQVRISESNAPVDFEAGGVDLAIRMRDEHDLAVEGMEVTPFLDHWQGPVLAPELAAGAALTLQAMAVLPRLYTRSYRQDWSDWTQRMGMELAPAPIEREFDHYFYMLEAAIAGLGVAIGPWPFVIKELAAGRLIAPFGFVKARVRYVILLPRRNARPAARRLRDWLVEEGALTLPPDNVA
jgi:LysR family glycine cleavage system transcriptional activator